MKRSGVIVLLLLALAGAVAARLRWTSNRGPAPAPAGPAVDAAATPAAFEVASATGTVEVQRDGHWTEIHPGDRLTRADIVRTSAASAAVLRLDAAGTEIELRAGVEIALDRLPGGASVDLRRGRVLARVRAAEALAITAENTRTTGDGPARFVVQADGKGSVTVAALEGSARFSAAGKSVQVPAGSTSSTSAGGPPEDPERIPEEVLLNVVWPPGERHGEKATIEGRTARTSIISVNGTATPVGPDGRFSATVPLRDGKNVVDVTADDIAGRTRKDSTTLIRRPPPPPKLTPESTDLWKNNK